MSRRQRRTRHDESRLLELLQHLNERSCVSVDLVAAAASGAVNADGAAQVRTHLATCLACTNAFAGMQSLHASALDAQWPRMAWRPSRSGGSSGRPRRQFFELHDLANYLEGLEGGTRTGQPLSILIRGETGTGKSVLARMIHQLGRRCSGPLVEVNVAAIPEALLETELFGEEGGAVGDGARRGKRGLLEMAPGGTLVLEEVGLLSLPLQSKLLRVIEEQEVRRLEAVRREPVDVSIVAVTNEDLAVATQQGRFREDLYQYLTRAVLELPPLRERRGEDILALADHFLARVSMEHGVPPKQLPADARAALLTHPWPGNVRELANVIERAVLVGRGAELTAEVLGLRTFQGTRPIRPSLASADALEPELLRKVLRWTDWNISRAAALLDIPPNALRARIRRHGLERG